jgi:two-component system NtrC family sensor kinase
MSSLGQMVAGVAHEINNPVNFIYGNLTYCGDYVQEILQLLRLYQKYYPDPPEELAEKADDIDLDFIVEDLPKILSSMEMGAERIRQIVLSLRNFSRLDEADKKPVNVHEGIDNTLLILDNRFKSKGKESGIEIVKEYSKLPKIECYAGQLNQVFMNIIANAIDALEHKKGDRIITIHTETIPANSSHPEGVQIRMKDNGPGMTEEIRNRLFDPFFTTKPVGKGTGLGLSISYQIVVDKHGGNIQCLSQPGDGSEFIIEIPIPKVRNSQA